LIFKFRFHLETNISALTNKHKSDKEDIYDLILLDYLFRDVPKELSGKNSLGEGEFQRHYGISLLKKIKEGTKLNLKKAPLDSYWILPISTFSSSMFGEMRNQQISQLSNHYFLSNGADPINTPFYFIFEILSIIKTQIETISNTYFEALAEMNELVEFVFDESSEVDWPEQFFKVANLMFLLDRLDNDKDEGNFSVLMHYINIILKVKG